MPRVITVPIFFRFETVFGEAGCHKCVVFVIGICYACSTFLDRRPWMKPRTISGECADDGGMYKYKVCSFWYVL